MEKLKLLLLIIIGTGFLGACSDNFLDSQPLTELTEAEYFKTQEEVESSLVGAYNSMFQSTGTVGGAITRLTDQAHAGWGNSDGYDSRVRSHFDMSISPGENNLYGGDWNRAYTTLFRVNLLLQKLADDDGDIEWNDPQRIPEIEGELRFIRAHAYFNLVRLFENVVLITEPTEENLPQSDPDEVYELIADDLLFASENAPSEISSKAKVTTWAAKSLLARVYLFYTGVYQESDLVGKVTGAQALQGLEDVIDQPEFGLVDDFKNLFVVPSVEFTGEGADDYTMDYAGKDNKEVVFAHRHNITPGDWGSSIGNPAQIGLGMRDKAHGPHGFGWGASTVIPEFHESFEDGDPRRDASIVDLEAEYDDVDNSDWRDYTGLATRKYIPLALPNGNDYVTEQGGEWGTNQHWDFVYMRFADVLLMAAELGSPNAQNYFDQVRDRVGLPSKPVNTENLMEERNHEFAFEGLRYFDLLRQGVDVLAEAVSYDGIVLDGGTEYNKVIEAQNIIEKRGFQQIPQNQINISNGVLEQNEGW
ncbi:MAG: RagB/SusD family nutrient uptake outer membrane protein [Balneolales bacterium]